MSKGTLAERFFAGAEDLLAVADLHGRILEANPAWQTRLGWSPHDLVGRHYLDFVHPDDRPAFGSEALRLIEPGTRVTGSAGRWRAADGSWHLLSWTARSADGLIHAVARDVTADARAERALQESEQRLDELGGHLDEILFIAARARGASVEWASPSFERVWGRPVSELLSDSAVWQRDVVPEDIDRVLGELRRNVGEEREVRYRIVRPDTGELRHMRTRLRTIAAAPGQPERVAGITEDVTDQVLREQRLERQAAGHAAVAELSQAALESDDVEVLLDQAVAAAHELLDGAITAVLEHAGSERFVPRSRRVREGLPEPGEFAGDSQAAHTLRTGRPVIVEDAALETRFAISDFNRTHGLVSGVSVVVGRPGHPWGVLGVLSTERRTYSAEDLHLLQSIGHVLGHAIERRRAAEALEASQATMERAHRLAQLGSYWVDTATGRAEISEHAHALLGTDPASDSGELEPLLLAAVHPEDLPKVRDVLARAAAGETITRFEHRTRTGRWIEVRNETMEAGARLVGTLQDITDRKASEERLRSSEQRFRHLVETAAEGVWVADLEGRAVFVNRRAGELSGRAMGDLVGMRIHDLVHPEDHPVLREGLRNRRAGAFDTYDVRLIRPGGEVRWLSVSASPLRDESGQVTGSLAMASDITERRAAEEEAHLARQHFEGAFRDAPIGMGVISPEGRFLSVNSALCAMTGLAEDELRGRHFDDITPPENRGEAGERFAELLAGATQMVSVERPVLRVGDEPLWCLILATATRDAQGRLQSVVVQLEDVTERRREQARLRSQVEELAWLERIRAALETDAFVLHAQPIVDADTGECLREELLIRMRLGDRIIAPGAFLPIAERHGLIQAIDAWVADRAAALAAGGRPVQMNVSAVSAGDPRFLEALEAALDRHRPPRGSLIVELTETALAHDMEQAREFAACLERLGVPLALDDFGVGWASLQYLKSLPGLSCLKIDASFVRDLVSEERSRALVRAIVALARSFGQETIAEGVEDEATRQLLCRLGVDALQGYLLGRPVPL